jgi:SAM-dependent methyltransferase
LKASALKHIAGLTLLAAAAVFTSAAHGQAAKAASKGGEFQPQVGQAGKDVIWVPTPDDLVERMLRMAQTTASDVVYDLGSGDGRTVIAAAKKFGATATGIEYNPDMVTLSQRNAQREGVTAKTTFMKADLFETDFSKATVITMYLLPSINAKLKPKLLGLKPGTRIVSHAFDMEDWNPDQADTVEGRRAMLWIVPARVNGVWRMRMGDGADHDLSITQRYQALEGTLRLGKIGAGLRDPRIHGDQISFGFMDAAGALMTATAKVTGDSMEGTLRSASGQTTRFTARR